jgi:sugar O-acyltransferase (sialic acid O-acetyltransferase NeuD family)
VSTLFICGAGNPAGVRLAISVNNVEKNWDRIAILDDDPQLRNSDILGCEVLGGFDELVNANQQTDQIVNLVAAKTSGRWKVRSVLEKYGLPFAQLIHPGVDTFGVTFGGDDITVYDNATLGACSFVGDACIVFMNAVLGHRAHMDCCSILGPGAVLNARVQLGERAYFGTNASILPDLNVGADATVGANSSVVTDIPEGATAVGVPAQILTLASTPDESTLPAQAVSNDPDLRKKIEHVWKNILGVNTIRAADNFFDVGGTSLKAMQVFESLKQLTQSPLAPIDIFRFPTIDALCRHLGFETATISTQTSARAQTRRQRMLHRRSLG